MLADPFTRTVVLYFAAIGLHLVALFALWRLRRPLATPVLALGLGNLLLGVRVFFPAVLAAQSGLYDATDAVLSCAIALALAVAAQALARPE